MKNETKNLFIAVLFIAATGTVIGCAEEGDSGEAALDCGEHGTEHDGHCHCDDGWLFDGTTCVTPEKITEICEEHTETDTDTEEEHHHETCLCPDGGKCHCEEGTIETYDGADYCVPDLHADE